MDYFSDINTKYQNSLLTMQRYIRSLLIKFRTSRQIFVRKIIKEMKKSVGKIVSIFRHFLNSIENRKLILKNIIYTNLVKNSILIQKHLRAFMFRRKFSFIIKNRPKNYIFIITEKIERSIKIAHLRIKLKEDYILLKFEKFKLGNLLYTFIHKKFVDEYSTIKANFFIDGVMLNNLKYKTEYNEEGDFLNVIKLDNSCIKKELRVDKDRVNSKISNIKKSLSLKLIENTNKTNESLIKENSEDRFFFKPILKLNKSKNSFCKRVSFSDEL